MKKLSALLLALLLAATMCVGAMAETVSYVGTWVLTSVASAGMSFDPATLGMEMSIVLREDGTSTMSVMGMAENGTWVPVEGGIDLTDASGVTQTLTYRDGALVIAAEGIEMILTPGTVETDDTEYAQILANLTLADFNGTWVMEHVESTYGYYTIEDLGAEMTVVMADGNATIEMISDGSAETYAALCETEEADGLGTILWASFVDENGQPDGSGMMFLLFDDGQLVWYEYDSAEEAEFYYCFDKVVE